MPPPQLHHQPHPETGSWEFSALGLVHTEPPAFRQLLLGFTTLALGSREGSCGTHLWPTCLSLQFGIVGAGGAGGNGLPSDLTSWWLKELLIFQFVQLLIVRTEWWLLRSLYAGPEARNLFDFQSHLENNWLMCLQMFFSVSALSSFLWDSSYT